MKDQIVTARSLTVVKNHRKILDNVNFSLSEREIVTIVGPNGSGKTTFVRVLAGLETTYQGHVNRRPGIRIGWLPQKLHVDTLLPLTVRRFLSLGAHVPDAIIRQNMEETGTDHLWKQSLHNLSGGELQRVMLTRALLAQPDFLILDEPAQGVDYRGQSDIYDLVTRIRDTRHCAIIMISHDLHIVMSATDRVVCLHHHVCCSGHPHLITQDPAWSSMFGSDASRGIAVYGHEGHHRSGHDTTAPSSSDHTPQPPSPPSLGRKDPL